MTVNTDLAGRCVLTAGCFDLFHAGHLAWLERAARHGPLVVSVGRDETVERLKGRPPVDDERHRLALVRSLRCVAHATLGPGEGPLDWAPLLPALRPRAFVAPAETLTPAKQLVLAEAGVPLVVQQESGGSHSSDRRGRVGLPYRILLGGHYLDQPHVSRVLAGHAIPLSITAPIVPPRGVQGRSGLASSTRQTAQSLWGDRWPAWLAAPQRAELLFAADNPPDKPHLSGAIDAYGLAIPGVTLCVYTPGEARPRSIESAPLAAAAWLAGRLWLYPTPARPAGFTCITDLRPPVHVLIDLAAATERVWAAVLMHDLRSLQEAIDDANDLACGVESRALTPAIEGVLHGLRRQGWAGIIQGAGGGGYVLAVGDGPPPAVGQTPPVQVELVVGEGVP